MEAYQTISEELQLISPFLAKKRPGHPYQVPDGYFFAFPGTVTSQLPSMLLRSINMPMDVPTGYFDGLASTILNRIKATGSIQDDEFSKVLAGIGKNMPFNFPVGYFESLNSRLASVVWNESAPSVLTMIGRKTPFEIPAGYFNSFPASVTHKLKQTTKQGQVYPLRFVKKVYRYAAAAIIVGIISVTALMYFRNETSNSSQVSVAAADMNTISSDELQTYVSGLDLFEIDNSIIASNNDLEAEDLKEFLNDLPDQALQQYVQEYTQPNTN